MKEFTEWMIFFMLLIVLIVINFVYWDKYFDKPESREGLWRLTCATFIFISFTAGIWAEKLRRKNEEKKCDNKGE